MSFLAKVAKLFSPVKAVLARRRNGRLAVAHVDHSSVSENSSSCQADAASSHAHQPQLHPVRGLLSSQPSTSAAHDPIPPTENPQLSTPSALAITAKGADDYARDSDGNRDSWISRGFAAFKSALEVTKELAEPFPPLKYAATALLIVMEGFDKVKEVQEDFEYVADKLTFMQTIYNQHRLQLEASKSTRDSMVSLALTMRIVEKVVQTKSDRGIVKRMFDNSSDVKQVANALRMLGDVVDRFITSVTVSTYALLVEGLQEQALDKLHAVESAHFDSSGNGRPCTQGTRAEFLADLLTWAMAGDQPRICWVNGAAGSGKTTIAHTLCSLLQGLGLLGGSFFCARNAERERRSIEFIFSTLARSLAYHDGAYAHSLAEALKRPGAGSVDASKQLTDLIAAAFRSAHSGVDGLPLPIRIFVIDALDECGNDPTAVNDLIRRLVVESHGLHLKFLIISRPEPHITQAFETADHDSYLVRRVQDIPEDAAKADVKTYLETELTVFARNNHLPNNWPSETQIQALSRQANTLFIYASTARKYICQFADDPVARLDDLIAVRAEPWRGIDPMYEFVLDQARRSKTDRTWNTTRRCLQAIICLSHPLGIGDLGDLLEIDHREVRTALSGLQSVLNIPSSDDSDTITIFHASFPDYLLDAGRSQEKDWSFVSAVGHGELLQQCVPIMASNLCFNISKSSTSYATNDLQSAKPVLSEALIYSCLHWIDHLEGCGGLAISELAEFGRLLMDQFLYWLEVLSMTSEVRKAPTVMTRLLNWLHAHTSVAGVPKAHFQMIGRTPTSSGRPDDLIQFARDARDFVNRFAEPIEKSCPHIYLSALAATTSGSVIWTKMSPMFRGLPEIITRQAQHVSPIFILYGHEGSISSVAFSPDGTHVVSGSSDCTIRLWDAATGAAIGDPLRGHEGSILSFAFSPDGKHIVSGSEDRTIRLWNAATGAAIGDPFCGYEGSIMSVAFSPDGTRIISVSSNLTIQHWDVATGAVIGNALCGNEHHVWSLAFSPDQTRIVSGSMDGTIRLWDAATGATIGDPLRGHESGIISVAFSPDGTRVVSGSDDRTIRLWDAATGAIIGETLRGHEGWVNSIAFSPDGTRLVSGSNDRTIRLWDAATGVAIGEPLRGHQDDISSVAFSPDAKHVISASDDHTVRLWDATTGVAIGDHCLRGHDGLVRSVAFSPDGTRVVSGSDERTIRFWDAASGAAVGEPLRGHDNWVTSVAFSPDGKRVVSSSRDCTIRLWDAITGVAIGEPLRGHKALVWSVAFSPDGTCAVSGSCDRTIRLWDAITGAAIGDPLRGHKDDINSVAFSPDGKRVVSGSDDRTILLWDATTGAAIGDRLCGHKSWVMSVAFSPDGTRVVSGSEDRTIRLWDAATGNAIGKPLRGHGSWVRSVRFSPEGTRVVSCSDDRTIRLWDASTGVTIGDPFRGHDGFILSVEFSPDGTRIVSGSSDRTIRLWDTSTGATISDPMRGRESYGISTRGTGAVSDSCNRPIWSRGAESRPPHDDAVHAMNCSDVESTHRDSGAPSMPLTLPAHTMQTSNHLYRFAFSPIVAHATGFNALPPHRFDGPSRVVFSLDGDGWLRGPTGELFLWILPEYRRGLWWPRTEAIMGAHPVMLDLSRFVHGEDWTKCFQHDGI